MAILFRIHVLYLGCRARVYVRVLVCVCVCGCVVVARMGMAKRLQDLGTDTKKWTFYAYQYTLIKWQACGLCGIPDAYF